MGVIDRPPRAGRGRDRVDAVIIRIDPAAGLPERLLFEPRDGDDAAGAPVQGAAGP